MGEKNKKKKNEDVQQTKYKQKIFLTKRQEKKETKKKTRKVYRLIFGTAKKKN